MTTLVGDVGGTHTRLALAVPGDGGWRITSRQEYRSGRYDGLAPVVRRYLEAVDAEPDGASLGVACPIVEGACRLPNLEWEIEEGSLARSAGLREVRLVNDFEAVGHALAHLDDGDVEVLQEGREEPGAPRAVIGAGTGLGEGVVTPDDDGWTVWASEGGHGDFAARSPVQWELRRHLSREHGHVSYERVLSGPGLVAAYRFLVETGRAEEREETRRAMEEGDPAAAVSRRALGGTDPACERALDIFVSVYGAEAGNLALTVKATGGVYVAGGIAPKILEKLRDGTFLEAFREKGRMRPLVERIPVRVIVNPDVGLLGAAAAGPETP